MSRFWHLLVTDLRRHRWLLLLWLLIVAGSAATRGLMPMAAADPRAASQTALLYFLLSSTYVALFVLLVPVVVQTDAAVGSDAFWMTRPISPATLFSEKLAVVFVALAMLPVIADCILMALYEVPPRAAAGVAVQGVLARLLWMAALMALAALTASLPRFALLAGVLMAVLVALMALTVAITVAQFNEDPPLSQGGTFFSDTAVLLAIGGLLAAGILIPLVQYVTRRRALAIAAGTVCAVLGVGTASRVPALAAHGVDDAPARARESSRVQLSAAPEDARTRTQPASRSSRGWKLVSAPVYVKGLEPEWSAEVTIRESTWRTNGRTAWTSPAQIGSQPTRIEKDEFSNSTATRQLLGVSRVIEVRPSWEQPPSAVLAVVDIERFPSLPAATGTYAAKASVALLRHSIEGTVPLKQGMEYRHGAHRLLISRVFREAGAVTVLLRVSYANSMFDGDSAGERSYYIRNAAASDAIPVSLEPADISGLSFLAGMSPMSFAGGNSGYEATGFNVESWLLKVGSISGPSGPIWRLTEGWLDGAELVVVTRRREGSVTRDLIIDNFPLRTAPEVETR